MADTTRKRGSTGVRLYPTVGDGTSAKSLQDGDTIITVMPDGGAPVQYKDALGEIENIAAIGTYAAPTAGKCRLREVTSTAYAAGDGNSPIFELQLADALFASDGRGLTISITSDAEDVVAIYTVALSNLDVENGETDTVKISGSAPAADRAELIFTDGDGSYFNLNSALDSHVVSIEDEAITVEAYAPSTIMTTPPDDVAKLPRQVQWLFQQAFFQRVTTPDRSDVCSDDGTVIGRAPISVDVTDPENPVVTREKYGAPP